MAETISIDIQVLQGIFGDLTRVQKQLDGITGAMGVVDKATDNAMRDMVQDIMGPIGKSRELEQKLQELGTKVRTSKSVKEIVALKKEIAATQRELDRVNTGNLERKVSGGVGRMRSMFGSLIAPIAGVFAVSQISSFVGGMVKAAGAQQVFKSSLLNLLGTKADADKMFVEAKKFAATTPFDLTQVQQATQQFKAYGFANKDIIPSMRAVGNVASAVGADFGQVARAYGTARTQGTVYTRDLMQFTNVGIPIMDALAATMGVNVSQVKGLAEQGKIGFGELEVAMNSLGGPTGKWKNQLADASGTITGRLSNLGDDFHSFVANLGVSLAPLIESSINGLNSALDGVKNTVAWIQEHGPLVRGVITGIAVAVGIYTTALAVNSAATFYNTLLTKGAMVALGLQTTWTTLVTAATTLWTGAQWLLNAALTANPIGVVVMAIAALVGGIIYAWNHCERFRAVVMGMWEVLKATFAWVASAVRPIIDGLVLGFKLWWASVQATWAALVGMFQAIGAWLGHVWEGVQGFIGKVTGAFGRLADILMAPFKKVFEMLSHIPGFSKLVGFAKDIGNKVGAAFSRGQAEGVADFHAETAGEAKGGTTNAKAIVPTGNVGAASLLGGTAPGAPAATGGAGATVSGSSGGDKNIAMNITMNMQFGIGRDVQTSARDTAEQVVAMITNKLRDAQFALG